LTFPNGILKSQAQPSLKPNIRSFSF